MVSRIKPVGQHEAEDFYDDSSMRQLDQSNSGDSAEAPAVFVGGVVWKTPRDGKMWEQNQGGICHESKDLVE